MFSAQVAAVPEGFTCTELEQTHTSNDLMTPMM